MCKIARGAPQALRLLACSAMVGRDALANRIKVRDRAKSTTHSRQSMLLPVRALRTRCKRPNGARSGEAPSCNRGAAQGGDTEGRRKGSPQFSIHRECPTSSRKCERALESQRIIGPPRATEQIYTRTHTHKSFSPGQLQVQAELLVSSQIVQAGSIAPGRRMGRVQPSGEGFRIGGMLGSEPVGRL